MAKDISAKKEKAKGFVGGSALYQQRAAQALPLVLFRSRNQGFSNKSLSGYKRFCNYSERNTLIGSIDIARRAGK